MLAVVYLCIEVAWGSFGVTAFNTKEVDGSAITKKSSGFEDIGGIIGDIGVSEELQKILENM